MTDYECIKRKWELRPKLWEDTDFPACQASTFYHQMPPFQFDWKRAWEIYRKPVFISDTNEAFDVIPGKLGDNWLVSCLGVIFQYKGLFHKVVPPDQNFDGNYAGVFRFRLWWCGQWVEVLVDDLLPTVNGKLAFVQSSSSEELWPALLEKAYAKLHGSYEALKYGSLLEGLADLTGGLTEMLPTEELNDAVSLCSMLDITSIVTAHYFPQDHIIGRCPLEMQMNYTVCEVREVDSSDGPVHVVRLQRPLSKASVGRSHVIIDEAKWMSIPSRQREHLISSAKSSSWFWMLFSDFKQVFPRLETLYLDEETSKVEPSLLGRSKWQTKIYHSGWKRGVNAGGCRNNNDFFHLNPQVQLTLKEPSIVIVSLSQHKILEPKVIGFSIFVLPSSMPEKVSQGFFNRPKSAMNSNYSNCRHMSHRFDLVASEYLIIPTTFSPREEANFTLRIFSNRPMNLKVLDELPRKTKAALLKAPSNTSFGQYEALFLRLADEHRTIDIFELQELLDACLPNDYIKSCVTIDTCRQIVLSLDKNGSGRISLSDFKDLMCSLKHWQQLFKTHAVEKMGVIRAERFRDALRDAGFHVPEKVMSLLVLRCMRKDGMLRFGDYVSAVLHLHRAFDVFYSSATLRSNNVQMDLSAWLTNAFIC